MQMTRSEWLARDRALFFPAISTALISEAKRGAFAHIDPAVLSPDDLDYLNPTAPWHYPFTLFSAGQVNPKTLAVPKPDMVMARDRHATIVLGDSGGYQIASGAAGFEYTDDTPALMLNWLEHMADWSMGLDFPTGTDNSGRIDRWVEELKGQGIDLAGAARATGLSEGFHACLTMTCQNNDRFVQLRVPGKTRLLNVLQGRNHTESKHWYEAVKHYPFQGWAFASAHQSCPSMIVARLLDMHNDGILENVGWLHVLGTAKLEMGCVLTAIQQEVRKLGYTQFQISFDAASATTAAVNGQLILGHTISAHGWATQTVAVSELLSRFGSDTRPLADVMDEVLQERVEGDQRRRGLANTYIARNLSLVDLDPNGNGHMTVHALGILHNTQALILAHTEVQDNFYEEAPIIYDPTLSPVSVSSKVEGVRQLFAMPNGAATAKVWGRNWMDKWQAPVRSRAA